MNAQVILNLLNKLRKSDKIKCLPSTLLLFCNKFNHSNLLNELRKSDKMRSLPSILLHFCNKLSKFNNTKARMLNYIYHMTLKLLLNLIFCHIYTTILQTPLRTVTKICKPLVVY